ncbi:Myelin regulatory factor homolog 2, N-terminal [Caenorhabditis elegans]|uniref:Isoform b of Myelin regulatory factor homolog 2 n=1 Tax=Caenorhabditis elegans TaxID=6239 RepID=D9PTN5-3|nr:Myelin regulatory factor homolog 2, N-terminal [Caenorhabditis elegans]CAD44121.1 Myelin regulatory factor homolog 2, N-terminal [Caenorhabditis elegans]|eukprot:NP_741883.1 Myelin regulatory factor homolog 2, N-terminal [Caenorhabditis elegans]
MVRRPVATRPPKEEGLNDPLANVEQFNIIQFLQNDVDFNLPIEAFEQGNMDQNIRIDPILQRQQMANQPMLMPQHMLQQLHQQQIYEQQLASMPMTPAITDLTRHGSSSSPSTTNSDPPYSPEGLNNFGLGTQRPNHGVIPNDISNVPQHINRQFNPRMGPNTSPNPPSFPQFLNSNHPTPGSYVQSISPDSNGQGFAQSNLYNALNVSSDESINGSDDIPNRKRPRMDQNMDPSFIMHAPVSGKLGAEVTEEGGQPNIRFFKYQEEQWCPMYDANGEELGRLQVHVLADKGFNYSTNDNCFVNQKKNHFQVTVKIEAIDPSPPQCFKINGVCKPIENFQLSFVGAKSESQNSEIPIRQSTTERKPILHTPVLFKIVERRMTIVTVPRLHFSETTLNNQRKNLRPNPDQKYFNLVVRLYATATDGTTVLMQAFASERVIVRATNPGSFEPPEMVDASWNKNGGILSTNGPVVIGKSEPRAQLTVDGDIYSSGRVMYPSDIRLKDNITEKGAKDALENLQKLRIVDYFYKPEVASKWGLTEDQRKRTGVIAQELAAVLPDAVKDLGDYLTVNESRVFYETVLATQELCRLTGDLDQKIDDKVAEISQRLTQYAQKKKMLNSMASGLNSEGRSLNASRTSLDSSASALTLTNTKKNRRSSRKDKKDAPKSKMTHGTVIGLVGVMAFCLLAMSALYILDWHNRNFGYHHFTPSATTSGPKEGPGNVVIPLDHYVPLRQPDAPPLVPFCPMETCRGYCCMEYDKDHAELEITEYDPNTATDNDFGFKADTRSDFTLKGFGNNVKISLPELGMQIDERYCIEKSCVKKRKVYSLFIPMTRYLPNVPLEVQIDVPSSKVVNNCGYIQEFDNRKCDETGSSSTETDAPRSIQLFDNTFQVSAGQWTQSAYRFRVGYSTELCSIDDTHFGGFYEEYNLIFYRACNRTNSTAINVV